MSISLLKGYYSCRSFSLFPLLNFKQFPNNFLISTQTHLSLASKSIKPKIHWCCTNTLIHVVGIVFFCLPQSHHVTFCFTLNHWDEKRMLSWMSTELNPRKCWFNSHLGHICSKPITSLLIYLESNSLAEGQWNLQVSFLCLYNEMVTIS